MKNVICLGEELGVECVDFGGMNDDLWEMKVCDE